VHGQLDSDTEIRDGENHLRERISHVLQGSTENQTAILGREGDEPAFQAQLTGFGLAFPAVSAGIFGWPVADAARIAVATVRATPSGVADARFVLFSADVFAAFEVALAQAPG